MSARKIETWHTAGLIDAATRDRLVAYEAAHARPIALWAVFGVGALAIGLGLISVVAANWEEIPGQLRLGVHLTLIAAGLIGLLLHDSSAEESPFVVEAMVFITGAMGLTFLGHLGQVYQTSSPLWQPLGLWLALFAPLMLVMGRSWLTAAAVAGIAMWCAWDYAGAHFNNGADRPDTSLHLWIALVTAFPVMFAPVAAGLRARSARSQFWLRLEQLGLAYAVGGASLACTLASVGAFDDGTPTPDMAGLAVRGGVAVLAGFCVALARPGTSGRMAGAIIAGAGLTLPLAYLASDATVPAALLFMGLWGGIAAAALAAPWRGVFQLSIGVIALRLIILSFELASDLLLSGFGLILAGLLTLVIGWGALKVTRRLAPDKDAA